MTYGTISILPQACKIQKFLRSAPDLIPGKKIESALVLHDFLHIHILTHGILLGNNADFLFEILPLSSKTDIDHLKGEIRAYH